jgi:hypothetical protein
MCGVVKPPRVECGPMQCGLPGQDTSEAHQHSAVCQVGGRTPRKPNTESNKTTDVIAGPPTWLPSTSTPHEMAAVSLPVSEDNVRRSSGRVRLFLAAEHDVRGEFGGCGLDQAISELGEV